MCRLRWMTLGLSVLPLACGCEDCPNSLACLVIAAVLSAAAFYGASLLRELWLLSKLPH
jgi:hypothetical protein